MFLQLLFIFIAAGLYGATYGLQFNELKVHQYSFWGKNSWIRKYRNYAPYVFYNQKDVYDLRLPKLYWYNKWYYDIFEIKYQERFPLSATVLVFLTDGHHLLQFLMLKFVYLAVVMEINSYYLVVWAIWALGFNIVFSHFERK